MKKTMLYRLFRIGSVPKKLLPVLEKEGIVVMDEGMAGRFIAKQVNGPGKRYRNRSEGFSGCLVITKQRIIAFTYGKRQINISVEDPNISNLYVGLPEEHTLSVSFESSVFREGWEGVMEFRFNTEKAHLFRDALVSVGTREGVAQE